MSATNTSNLTSGFIDLATYDELEKYLYGCGESVSYFVKTTTKSSWFTQVPVILPTASGTAGFGKTFSVNISRAGDYLLNAWLRVGIPPVTAVHANIADVRLRWTQNLMHNLVKEVSLTFNDLLVAKFDSFHLDMWAAFTVPAGKQAGYATMIGQDVALMDLTDAPTDAVAKNFQLPPAKMNLSQTFANGVLATGQPAEMFLNLPLPFFFSRDSGVALPTAALPYNDMVINFTFRNWDELLIAEEPATNTLYNEYRSVPTTSDLVGGADPKLTSIEVWANYALVSNDERKRMACAPRDILIEQAQMINPVLYAPDVEPNPRFDLRLSHAIKVLFFAVRNVTFDNERSVYTVGSPMQGGLGQTATKFASAFAVSPLATTSLVYENTNRLGDMGEDYFTHVNPYYTAPVIPQVAGFHCYSYSLDLCSLDPMGSTNYGKLNNVSIIPIATQLAIAANKFPVNTAAASTNVLPIGTAAAEAISERSANGSGVNIRQKYEFNLTCINFNIVRISGGSLGFPIL